jgi:dsDNA-binding SOS-regulon protein
MAPFNPEVQQTPGYLYGEESARAISPIAPDQSKEILLKGAGKALTGGVQVAEDFEHQSILTAEHQGLDTINDQAISRLTEAKANPSLLAKEEGTAPPEAVKGLPSTLDKLDQARVNGKISQTYIDMQKDTLAKQLRSQYPGFREFIDESFSKSTREDPANRYISSLVGDINSLAAAGRAQKDKTEHFVMEGIDKGFDNWDTFANAWYKGKMTDDQIRSEYYRQSHEKALQQKEDHDIIHENHVRESQQRTAENIVSERVNKGSVDYFDAHMTAFGTMADILKKTQGPMDSQTAQQFATQVESGKNQWLIDMDRELGSPIDGDPKNPSYKTLLGPEKIKNLLAEGANRFDLLGKMFTDERAGIATASTRMAKSAGDDARLQLLDKNTAFGRTNLALTELSKSMAPSSFEKLISEIVIPGDYDKNLAAFIQSGKLSDMTQPDGPDKPHTATETITKVAGLGNKVTDKDKADAVKDTLSTIDKLHDAGVDKETKQKIVTSFFSPGNREMLSLVARNNKMDVLKQLANDQNAKEIYKLGDKSWSQYSDWVKSTFGTQVFPNEIRELNEIQSNPKLKIGWNNEDHKIVLKGSLPEVVKGSPSVEQGRAEQAVARINAGIDSIKGLAKYEKMDVNAYIYKILVDSDLKGMGAEFRKAMNNQ